MVLVVVVAVVAVHLSICLPASLNTQLFCETTSMFDVDNVKSENNSARLPHFLNLTTSKTKQVCETSSFFEVDNIKNETILRDFLQKWKVECRADSLVPMRFAIFDSTCLNYCACHEKVIPGHTKCCTCHAKSPQQTWRSDAPKCSPSQEISALTS